MSDELDPTTTLPKLRLVGDTANWPAAVPFPETAILSGEFDAFDITERLPLAAPAAVGLKVAVNVTLWFALRLMGKLFNPLTEKAAPVTFTSEMATVDPPPFETVIVLVWLDPTLVFPKLICEGLGASAPGVATRLLPAKPWHPASNNRLPALTRKEAQRRCIR